MPRFKHSDKVTFAMSTHAPMHRLPAIVDAVNCVGPRGSMFVSAVGFPGL